MHDASSSPDVKIRFNRIDSLYAMLLTAPAGCQPSHRHAHEFFADR